VLSETQEILSDAGRDRESRPLAWPMSDLITCEWCAERIPVSSSRCPFCQGHVRMTVRAQTTPKAAAGWYADPSMVDTQRYWDGERWTDYRAPTGVRGTGATTNVSRIPAATKGSPDGVRPPTYRQRRRSRWWIQGAILVALAMGGLAYEYEQGHEESTNAPKVGECARKLGKNTIERVDCADPRALLRVTSRVDDTTDGESACADDQEATSFYSFDASSHGLSVTSFVLCLTDD
jgi:hypothetical protein